MKLNSLSVPPVLSHEDTQDFVGWSEYPDDVQKRALEYREKIKLKKKITFLENLLHTILTDPIFVKSSGSKSLNISSYPNADTETDESYITLYNTQRARLLEAMNALRDNHRRLEIINNDMFEEILQLGDRLGKKDATIALLFKIQSALEDTLGENVLTGLPTERILKKKLEKINKKDRSSVRVCYMDLTDFKNVNTVIHYENADRVLKIYGDALTEAMLVFTDTTKKITPYHPHGDEYAVIFENISNEEIVEYTKNVEKIAQAKIEKFVTELQQYKDEKGNKIFSQLNEIYTNLSFGVANFTKDQTVEDVILRAQKLLDGVKYFHKGNTLIEGVNHDEYIIHAGYLNSDTGYTITKTTEEVQKLIKMAEQTLEIKEKEATMERKRVQQKILESTKNWRQDYSMYPNLPGELQKSLSSYKVPTFSDEFIKIQKENAKNNETRMSTAEKYLNRTLNSVEQKRLQVAYRMRNDSLHDMVLKRDFLKKHKFSVKEIKILMRSGLLGIVG